MSASCSANWCARRWATKPAFADSRRWPCRSTRRWSRLLSTCRGGPICTTTSRFPERRFSANRHSIRSWSKSSGVGLPWRDVHAAHRVCPGQEHAPHHRSIVQGRRPSVARRRARRRVRCALDEGHAVTSARIAGARLRHRQSPFGAEGAREGRCRCASHRRSRVHRRGRRGGVARASGAFGACMQALRAARLDDVAVSAAASGRPFLGICVGMQMLYEGSDESPNVPGLALLPGRVRLLEGDVKRPQMQWNRLVARTSSRSVARGAHPQRVDVLRPLLRDR